MSSFLDLFLLDLNKQPYDLASNFLEIFPGIYAIQCEECIVSVSVCRCKDKTLCQECINLLSVNPTKCTRDHLVPHLRRVELKFPPPLGSHEGRLKDKVRLIALTCTGKMAVTPFFILVSQMPTQIPSLLRGEFELVSREGIPRKQLLQMARDVHKIGGILLYSTKHPR